MSVDTRAHIEESRAVVRRTTTWRATRNGYRHLKAVAIRDIHGNETIITVRDLGAALRALKISAADLASRADA